MDQPCSKRSAVAPRAATHASLSLQPIERSGQGTLFPMVGIRDRNSHVPSIAEELALPFA